ncbi:MAG: hypothetical protein JW703_01735 [Candidatus Diapherotrites archaeon]|nr:hypothetical protein [Candidatus Diapherotrites archaeon]
MNLKKNQILGLICFAVLILLWVAIPFVDGKHLGSLVLLLLGIYLMIK